MVQFVDAKRDTQRGCYFCETKPRTREHIIPNWMAKEFPQWELSAMSKNVPGPDGFMHESKIFRRSILRQTVKETCARCNNGWMSGLESQVQDKLLRLVIAEPAIFTTNDLHAFMRWTVKTHMMRAQLDEPGFHFPVRHRQEVRGGDGIPQGWDIWIGRTWTDGVRHNNWSVMLGLPELGPTTFSQVTLSIGGFTVTSSYVSDPDARHDFRDFIDQKVAALRLPFIACTPSPPTFFMWPPYQVASPEARDGLSDSMRQFANMALGLGMPIVPPTDFGDPTLPNP